MPQVFKIGSYWVYFWSNENDPLEPVHVHVSQGAPSANATKIWITKAGRCYPCHKSGRHTLAPPGIIAEDILRAGAALTRAAPLMG